MRNVNYGKWGNSGTVNLGKENLEINNIFGGPWEGPRAKIRQRRKGADGWEMPGRGKEPESYEPIGRKMNPRKNGGLNGGWHL